MLYSISLRQKILVMAAVMTGLFLVALDQMIIATALGKIVQEFNSFTSIGFIFTAYLLFSTVSVPIAGKFSDMFGRRPVLLTGVIIFTLASLLAGMAHSVEYLVAMRALQGLGAGIITANAFAIIADLFLPRERSKWQGIFGGVFGIASVAGPLLGGFLSDGHTILGLTTDWRWTFLINVPLGIIAAFIIARFCPAIRHDDKPSIDYAGAALITIALSAIVLATDNTDLVFRQLVDAGMSVDTIRWVLYNIFAIAAGAFIWVESRAKQPIISLKYFANRSFVSLMVAALLFGASFMGAILYLTQFNQQVFGADATTSGLMLLPMMAGMVITSATLGQVVARVGKYKLFIALGFALSGISVGLLATLNPDSPYWYEAILITFMGAGMGAGMPLMNLAVQNEFGHKDMGAATASFQLFRGLGSTVGTAIMSGVLTAGIIAAIGNVNNDPYLRALRQSPEAAKAIPTENDANTLLQINSQRAIIEQRANETFDAAPLPQVVRDQQKQQFNANQNTFTVKVTDAFTASLHTVFYIASGLMFAALITIFFLRERPLVGKGEGAPGVE